MKKPTLTAIAAIATTLAVLMTASPNVGAELAASDSIVQNAQTKEETTVTLTYPDSEINVTMGNPLPVGQKLNSSEPVRLEYMSGNPAIAKVNEIGVLVPVAPGKTTLTVAVSRLSEGYTGMVKLPVNVVDKGPVKLAFEPKTQVRTIKAAGRSFVVRTVSIPKGMPVTTGIANRKVGTTQSLAAMAASYSADIAINGTFFDSYSGIPDPYGNLMTGGLAEHIGNNGTTIGFKWDGSAMMDSLRLSIEGKVIAEDGRSRSWYAYFMNRRPTGKSAATLFTPQRGKSLGFAAENAVVVRQGVVTEIRHGIDVPIPEDGFVLLFQGSDATLATRFHVGDEVSYKVGTKNLSGKTVDWTGVHAAVGAGPRLVTEGKISLDASAEGFRDPKILTGSGARSGIAIMNDGSILLATVPNATMKQWAAVMVQLGAKQAMNLDGGASSGMMFNQKIVTAPGRLLSNALLFGKQLRY